jgi:uncharacterized protein DUF6893
MRPRLPRQHPAHLRIGIQEDFVNALRLLRNVVGTAGLLYAGYIFLNALPDLKRYIRISSM